MKNRWILLTATMAAGCATLSGSPASTGTRSDVKVSRGHYVIDMPGDGTSTRPELEAQLRRRAGDLCSADGFSAFDLDISDGKQSPQSVRQYSVYSQYTEDPQSSWLRERGTSPPGAGSLSATVSCRMISDNGTTLSPTH